MSFFSRYMQNINELQINGKTVDDNDDFSVGEDNKPEEENETPTASDTPADNAANAAEEETANNAPADDNPNTDDTTDEEDDFTLEDDEDNLDDTEGTTDEDDDFTMDDDNDTDTGDGEDANPDDGATEDDGANDDFTMNGDEGEDGEQQDAGEGAEGQQPADNGKKEAPLPANPTDAVEDEDNKNSEEEIYDSLTDEQKRIRLLQLKIDYRSLYETIVNTINGVNSINKNGDNVETINRLILLLTKSKGILIDYIENNFDSSTYIENYTMYIKYLAVFRTASRVIEELNKERDKK